MIFEVFGVSGRYAIIGDCESASEAMEVFRDQYKEPAVEVNLISLTDPDEDMADAFG